MNLALALLSALLLKLLPNGNSLLSGIITLFLLNFTIFNVVLAVFNALPIPPLDGSKILLGWSDNLKVQKFLNAYREGTLFIILIAFILPLITRYFGYDFNPLGSYLIKSSRWLISLFI